MTVSQCLLFMMILDITALFISIILYIARKGKIIIFSLAFLSAYTTLFIGWNTINGFRHGMYNTNITFKNMIQHTKLSPVEDILPSDIAGCIIVYYKFGCKDCESVYENLKKEINGENNIYWVSSRSKQGKKLLALYPVDVVPSGVYIYNTSTHYIKKVLYERNGENVVLKIDNLKRLLYLQKQNE